MKRHKEFEHSNMKNDIFEKQILKKYKYFSKLHNQNYSNLEALRAARPFTRKPDQNILHQCEKCDKKFKYELQLIIHKSFHDID